MATRAEIRLRAHDKRMAKTLAKLDRLRRRPKPPPFPPCPTQREVERAYEVIALDYVYGFNSDRPPKTRKAFLRDTLEFIELARDDEDVLQDPEYERLMGELEEMFLRYGGTPEELGDEADHLHPFE